MRNGFCDKLEKDAKARAANAKTSGLAKNEALAGGVAISLTVTFVMMRTIS
jgi:hypothetical protein